MLCKKRKYRVNRTSRALSIYHRYRIIIGHEKVFIRNHLSSAEAGMAVKHIMKYKSTLSPGPLMSLCWCYISTCFVLVMCCFLTRPWHAAMNSVLCLFGVFIAAGQMVSALYSSSNMKADHGTANYLHSTCYIFCSVSLCIQPYSFQLKLNLGNFAFCN